MHKAVELRSNWEACHYFYQSIDEKLLLFCQQTQDGIPDFIFQ